MINTLGRQPRADIARCKCGRYYFESDGCSHLPHRVPEGYRRAPQPKKHYKLVECRRCHKTLLRGQGRYGVCYSCKQEESKIRSATQRANAKMDSNSKE